MNELFESGLENVEMAESAEIKELNGMIESYRTRLSEAQAEGDMTSAKYYQSQIDRANDMLTARKEGEVGESTTSTGHQAEEYESVLGAHQGEEYESVLGAHQGAEYDPVLGTYQGEDSAENGVGNQPSFMGGMSAWQATEMDAKSHQYKADRLNSEASATKDQYVANRLRNEAAAEERKANQLFSQVERHKKADKK